MKKKILLQSIVRNNKPVIVFGAGETGDLVQSYFKRTGHPIALFIDNDVKKTRKTRHFVRVVSPLDGIRKHPQGFFVLANLNAEHRQQMSGQLKAMGVEEDQIVPCDARMIYEMENRMHFRYMNEDNSFIYHHPMRKDFLYYRKKIEAKAKMAGYKFLMNAIHPRKIPAKRYDVAICAIFKNEANYLKEWIEYHKIAGVGHFYLYNNFSEDHYAEVLELYIREGMVTLIDWPYPQGQMGAYRDCIKQYKSECRWIGFIDIDEFVLPIRDNSIYGFLRGFEKCCGSVLVYWRVFGSAGMQDRDLKKLVTEDFTVCWAKHSDVGKCFFNTSYNLLEDSKRNHILNHEMWTEYRGIKFPPVNIFGKVCIDGFHSANGGRKFAMQINHYVTKSYAEYRKKMQGTDVFFKDNPHNEQAFAFHDQKCEMVDVKIYRYLSLLKQKLEMDK